MTPPERVVAAMPGTLAELSERTEYPVGTVIRNISALRRNGVRVNARMSERTLEGVEPTVFSVVNENNAVQPSAVEV